MKRLILSLVFAALASGQMRAPDAEQFVGPARGRPLAGQELQLKTAEIGGMLRCPVCQGLSIADSPAEMARNMKSQVGELLSRGFTQEQILAYFERSYGQFVLLKPKYKGVTSLVWTLPLLLLLIGGGIVIVKMKSLEQRPPAAEAEVDEYLTRVRDLVGK